MRTLALLAALLTVTFDVQAQARGPYAPRQESAESPEMKDEAEEGRIRPEEDSWKAPPRAKDGLADDRSAGGIVRGMDVAGSGRVRERRNTGGQSASAQPQQAPGFHAVPLGGGVAIVVPDGNSYSGRDSFEYDSRPPADPIDGR